jgi:hypothetical protein
MFGAWYPLRFPASVFFSWVCMFYRFSLFVIRFPRHRDVLRSLSLSLLCRSFFAVAKKADRSRIFQWTVLSEQCRSPLSPPRRTLSLSLSLSPLCFPLSALFLVLPPRRTVN